MFNKKPEIIRHTCYANNEDILSGIRNIINDSYKIAGKHIEKDIELCNELYTIYNDDELVAFFMVGYTIIDNLDFCYLGLSSCKERYKNMGYVKALYLEFARDCIRRELQYNKRIICYWTTATPIVYHWFCKYFTNVQPDRDGNCTVEGKKILLLLANNKYSQAKFQKDTPFLLRQAAHQINYSDDEKQRISVAVKDLALTVFEKYNLNESNGDRFIMYGFTPNHPDLIRLTS
jgi:hypothetical protein